MKIAVFGAGYVGLVSAACFADKGNDVFCVDVDENKIRRLQQGDVPIYEPMLKELLEENKERLRFTTDAQQAVDESDIIFIAVGTPQKKNGFEADLQYVESVAKTIARCMRSEKFIVIKSTVPVGTNKKVSAIFQANTNMPFHIISNPEFLKEGDAIRDFEYPDRIIIGAASERAREVMHELYEPFARRKDKFIDMDNTSAELSKYGSNIMLAARIAIINELARVAQATGADIMAVKRGVGSDSRIGPAFLHPSAGYGGSCFPKDVREVVALSSQLHIPLQLIAAIDKSNEEQKKWFAKRIITLLDGVKNKEIAVWGAAFKARTDDVRESATLMLIEELLSEGARIRLHDPEAIDNVKQLFGDRVHYDGQYQVLEGAHALIIMTDWNEFRAPDFERMKRLLEQPIIIDSRNLYNPDRLAEHEFMYFGLGRSLL